MRALRHAWQGHLVTLGRNEKGPGYADRVSSPQDVSPPARSRDRRAHAVQRRGEVIANKYRIERLIAQGGMGSVYLATQLVLFRRVALKVLSTGRGDPTFERRFFLEASTYARLEHRHVVTVHDFGRTASGELYIAMEFLRGMLLSERLSREGRFEPSRAIDVATQLAWGLRAAHRRGIIHRDLKPSNVMLLEDGDADGRDFAKLLDFGIAKVVEPSSSERQNNNGNLTQAGTWIGSPRYMSPEQIQCFEVDARTDIYSLGIVLYELCTGHHPFYGRGTANLLRWHVTGMMPDLAASLPELPYVDRLDAVIHRCAEKDPTERFQSMGEVIEALRLCGANRFYNTDMGTGGAAVPGAELPPGLAREYRTGSSSVVSRAERFRGLGMSEGVPYDGVQLMTFEESRSQQSQEELTEQARNEAALLRLSLWIAVLAIPLSTLIVLLLVINAT